MRQTRGRGGEGIELRLGNGQIVAFVLGAMVLLGLTFALGIRVGQLNGESDVAEGTPQKKDRLAALDARAQARAASGHATDAQGRPSTESLTFAQELTRPPEPPAAPESAPEPAVKKSEIKKEETPKAADKVASAPVASEPRARPEPPAEKKGSLLAAFEKGATPSGAFALQVASVPSAQAAQDEVKRLTSKGLKAFVRAAEVKGTTYYRVRIGPYASKADAQAALPDVAQASGTRPLVVSAD